MFAKRPSYKVESALTVISIPEIALSLLVSGLKLLERRTLALVNPELVSTPSCRRVAHLESKPEL